MCNSHLLRELIAVTDTGTALDRAWAQQDIDALLALKDAAEAAREAGHAAIDQQARAEHEDWFRKAAATGIALNAARNGKLQRETPRACHPDAGPRGRLPAVRPRPARSV